METPRSMLETVTFFFLSLPLLKQALATQILHLKQKPRTSLIPAHQMNWSWMQSPLNSAPFKPGSCLVSTVCGSKREHSKLQRNRLSPPGDFFFSGQGHKFCRKPGHIRHNHVCRSHAFPPGTESLGGHTSFFELLSWCFEPSQPLGI